MPPNRIVALLTPVIAIAAGAAATWLADNVPGMDVSAGELQAVFVAALAAVLAPSAQWLHGYQKYESHQQEIERRALASDARVPAVDLVEYEDDEDDYDDDYESALDEAEPAAAVGA
jgi:hypothetical protein